MDGFIDLSVDALQHDVRPMTRALNAACLNLQLGRDVSFFRYRAVDVYSEVLLAFNQVLEALQPRRVLVTGSRFETHAVEAASRWAGVEVMHVT